MSYYPPPPVQRLHHWIERLRVITRQIHSMILFRRRKRNFRIFSNARPALIWAWILLSRRVFNHNFRHTPNSVGRFPMRPGVTVDIYNKCNACARRMFENRVKLCKEGLETGPDECLATRDLLICFSLIVPRKFVSFIITELNHEGLKFYE